jgi:hypothetical protein
MCYVTQLTRRSRGRELGQEGMCNRVRDRYEDKVVNTLAHAMRSSRCGHQLCKRHERSNMWYKRELIKNTYSTTAYAGLTAMWDLPWFIVYHKWHNVTLYIYMHLHHVATGLWANTFLMILFHPLPQFVKLFFLSLWRACSLSQGRKRGERLTGHEKKVPLCHVFSVIFDFKT